MFREVYKKANNCIDTEAAKERVLKNLDYRKKYNFPKVIVQVAACLVIVFVGISAYNMNGIKDDNENIMPINEAMRMQEIPIEDKMAKTESLQKEFFIEDSDKETFSLVKKDKSYTKREVQGITIYEKSNGENYECWAEHNGKIKKISGKNITEEEIEKIILSVWQ